MKPRTEEQITAENKYNAPWINDQKRIQGALDIMRGISKGAWNERLVKAVDYLAQEIHERGNRL